MFLLKKKVIKIALSANDDKRIKSIDLLETYANRTSKDLIRKKGKTKSNNIIKQCKKRLTLML